MAQAASTPLVNQAPQNGEELRYAVNLVENDEALLVATQEQGRVAELRSVLARLEAR